MDRRLAIAGLTALALSACGKKSTPKVIGPNEVFLEKNKAQPGVKITASGLQYKIVRANPTGQQAKLGDEVKVNYEGTLIDGTVFDSSYASGQPVIFPLDNLVPAWLEAIPMMHVGEEWIVVAPPALGYGEQARPSIPANSVLVFRIELLGILPAPQRGLA
jgi:peptidylprolyl isomerase/FKBP-type peptidyl-prolyl cis-trans isomerase FklB